MAGISHGYSQSVVDQVQAIIDSNLKGEVGPNTALWDIWDILAAQLGFVVSKWASTRATVAPLA